jgi:type IV pilus assembly protein PilA
MHRRTRAPLGEELEMLARLNSALKRRDDGFSMIELLVVIIIIGILAAIAIPIFLTQRTKGYVAADKAELNSVSTAEEAYGTDNNGTYTATLSDLKAQGYNQSGPFTATGGLTLTVSGDASKWCAQVKNSAAATVTYAQSSGTGTAAPGTCSAGIFTATTS